MRFTRISVDANKMGGVPCIRDLRLPVATVIDMLASGMSSAEILADFPMLEQEDIQEALRYASAALQDL
jgi:uncharacterized protein (DUF433 family)